MAHIPVYAHGSQFLKGNGEDHFPLRLAFQQEVPKGSQGLLEVRAGSGRDCYTAPNISSSVRQKGLCALSAGFKETGHFEISEGPFVTIY